MAYNILKGTVEFTGDNGSLENTVDLASDQSISGGKTFAQKLTASAIVLAGVPLVHPAITTVNNAASYRVALFDAGNPSNTLSGNVELSFRYGTLTSSYFSGSGVGLTNLQATELQGQVQGTQINQGNGLIGGGAMSVQQHDGITVDSDGVSVNVISQGGLAISGASGVAVDPTNALDITTSGQSLSDDDVFIAHDVSRGKIVKADALDIYSYVSGKLSAPVITSYTNADNNRIVTSVNNNTVNAEANLTFDGSILNLQGAGRITGSLELTGSAIVSGSLIVTGSDLDRLISLKSDSEDPAFFVSGSGDASLSGRLALKRTSDPDTLVDHAHIYSKLDVGTAEMFVRDSAGNVTKISPHNPEGEWEYFSRNAHTGKVVRVNMEKMIKKLEQITGESFMEEWYEDPIDTD